jgi:hypothetical protein
MVLKRRIHARQRTGRIKGGGVWGEREREFQRNDLRGITGDFSARWGQVGGVEEVLPWYKHPQKHLR